MTDHNIIKNNQQSSWTELYGCLRDPFISSTYTSPLYVQVIDDPKNRKIFLVQELMEGGALMPDSEKCDAMTNEVSVCDKWKSCCC